MTSGTEAAITTFKAAAEGFVGLVDSVSGQSASVFLAEISIGLSDLYRAALRMPAVAPATSDIDAFSWPREARLALYSDIKKRLGPTDEYRTVFDATSNEAPVQGSLAVDICDIYFDLKSGLRLLEREGPTDDVLWQLHFDFLAGCGKKCVERALSVFVGRFVT